MCEGGEVFVVAGLVIGGGEEGGRGGRERIDCRDDGEEVLEFLEVCVCCGDGAIEGVNEGGVKGAEGEFGDYVGEVESWVGVALAMW